MAGLRLQELKRLFPTGYLRGVCKIAGIPSGVGHLGLKYQVHGSMDTEDPYFMGVYDKTYTVDVRGFLVNPDEWDEYYAVYKAFDMKISSEGKLTDKHWAIIDYLRKKYKKDKSVPTIYETCEANQIDIPELEQLFPDGYHRGAVKIAGLRV
jgi:tRNA 2-thiouridine synthesizing protein E